MLPHFLIHSYHGIRLMVIGIEARLLGILEGQATPTSDEAEAATAAMQAFKARKKGQGAPSVQCTV